MFATKIKVAGVSFVNEDKTRRQELLAILYDDWFTEGKQDSVKLRLRPEPDNEVDPNAVGVWVVEPKSARGRIGFVPSEQAASIKAAVHQRRVAAIVLEDMKLGRSGTISAELLLRIREGEDAPEEEQDEEDDEAEEVEAEEAPPPPPAKRKAAAGAPRARREPEPAEEESHGEERHDGGARVEDDEGRDYEMF